MKALLVSLAAAIILVVPAALSSTAGAATKSTTCSYKVVGSPVYITLYGSDMTEGYCRMVTNLAGSSTATRVNRTSGAARCLLLNDAADIYTRVTSPSRLYGTVACRVLSKVDGWTRVW